MGQKGKIKRREFLNKSVLAVAGISTVGAWSKALGGFSDYRTVPALPNGRGYTFVIVGTKTPFLCHQPMFGTKAFNSPYRYQVILEASFGQSQDAYERVRLNDQSASEKILYTFDPAEFALSDLNRRTAPRTQMTGTISRRIMVEDFGEPAVEDVQANVKKIYFQEFNARTRKPTQLQYIMFGKMPEIFMAHLITRPPDFDHIVSLKSVDSSSFPEDTFSKELSRGLKVNFTQRNSITLRPRPNQGLLIAQAESSTSRGRVTIGFEVQSEIYLEEGELRTPPQYATTPAEKAAGFP